MNAVPRKADDHWWLLGLLALLFAGFWPSFFRRLWAGDLAHTLHGFTASGWVLALATQSWLISRGQRAWHRRVAVAGILVAMASIMTAAPMIPAMLRSSRGTDFATWGMRLAFYDTVTLGWFAGLVAVGLSNVRRPALHQRCLLATAVLALPPGLSRLLARPPIGMDFGWSVHASFWTADALLLWLWWRDRRAGVGETTPYVATLALLVLVELVLAPAAASETWRTITAGLVP